MLKGRFRRRKYSCLLNEPEAKIIGSMGYRLLLRLPLLPYPGTGIARDGLNVTQFYKKFKNRGLKNRIRPEQISGWRGPSQGQQGKEWRPPTGYAVW
jgi:hypothetical protein